MWQDLKYKMELKSREYNRRQVQDLHFWDQKTSHSATEVGMVQGSVRAIGENALAVGEGWGGTRNALTMVI